ncbi:type VI secretion protein IcmF/TssM N-terminal domain-containing protein [Bordetella sp. BOR01]|uniref:type VI secretion protein IcmF/TssM N-terminal domain-containing protein n=1 Tax=Bordetella sp. BOR01 TaxID=2854779 RepID=UPI001C49253C|nr:type VI secretion protein IcmF/TssM N-terminal domain-containing protein [Bordetella sp. BOR01]MBV7486019.1 SPOR domain-containing protein [Bordetella sp. BOR01]
MMFKKLLVLIAWLLGLILLALGCWLAGLYLQWPLWQSAMLFAGIIIGLCLLAWLRRRWLAWRLRRRLARPVNGSTVDTRRLDADWRAGLNALKNSRLSRFGSPLYVLPWYMALGPQETGKSELLRRIAGTGPVHGDGEEAPVLQWWLLRHCVVLDPTEAMGEEHLAPASANWRRLLHWMMRTRRREPLNGLILAFSADWLMKSDETQLNDTGQGLRKRLDELTRVYDARIPVYIVLTDCQALPGFVPWTAGLGPAINSHAMGFLSLSPASGVGQFISDAFNSIVHRMFDLRVLQGIQGRPNDEAFGLPERMAPLAMRLGSVLRPAFQATPYAETPLLRGLYLTGRPAGADHGEPAWFSPGLFDQALSAQRHAWQPLERWRHWRRLLRHVVVVVWLLACLGAGALLIHSSRVAEQQLHAADLPGLDERPDFSGPISSDLHSLQTVRGAVHKLLVRPQWEQRWLPFQRRVNQVQQALADNYARSFHQEVISADLDPLLNTSLPQLAENRNDKLLAAWVQTLVRRINLLDAALQDQNVYALPAPGTELSFLFASAKGPSPDPIDGLLLGDMYKDYLAWQPNHEMLVSERQALRQVLINLDLTDRPSHWIYAWVDLQGSLQPVRLTDFWNIPAKPGQPFVPAALTPAGEQAVSSFVSELGRASGNGQLWSQRRDEFRQQYLKEGLDAWYTFADAFASAPNLLADGTARRTALSTLFTADDPYRRLLGLLATVGNRWPAASRPDWMQQAIQLNHLLILAQKDAGSTDTLASSVKRQIGVAQQFGGSLLQQLPNSGSVHDSLVELRMDQDALNLLNAYRKNVTDAIVPLQQGDGNAMKAAIDIWSYGHDPNVKSVPLIDASTALDKLRKQAGSSAGPRTDVVWKLASGPLDFTLDYASRSVACRLQQSWENSVLSVMQGVNDAELANDMLFGDRGQVKAFMDGDVKHFIDQNANRYQGRVALGRTIPLNGQFYAFASLAQLRQVTLAGQQLQSKRSQDEVQALTTQQGEVDKQIAKLEATTANVTLRTVPPQTNPEARLLPESVTLSLQCASGRITLENLNFPNQAVFPWALANCGDTALSIRYPGFDLNRQWSGARGFIDFLREFSSGQRRYTTADFADQAASMQQAGVQWIVVTYQQEGQAPLVAAFADADKLAAQAGEVKARLEHLQPGTAPGSTMPPRQPAPALPRQIISTCMGPINMPDATLPAETLPAKAAAPSAVPMPPPPPPAPAPSGSGAYAVQVGIFAHPDPVRAQLALNGYEATESAITLKGHEYRRIRIEGFATRAAANAAATKIGQLLKLKPAVLHNGKVE